MRKDIKYSGYSATPSDYECLDGELATSLGLINEDGSLKPLSPAGTIYQFDEGCKLLYIHNVPQNTNYIVLNDKALYLYQNIGSPKWESKTQFYQSENNISKVTSIGNTLIVLGSDGVMTFFLWKADTYNKLGTEFPQLEAEAFLSSQLIDTTEMNTLFGLKLEGQSVHTISGTEYASTSECKELYNKKNKRLVLYGTVRQNIYERVFAIINQYNTILKREGYFSEPFYVRFAYRLFDGSHTKHTTPILLVPTTWGKPLATVRITETGVATFDPIFTASRLMANIILPDDFENWADIITGVDVFVTPPLIDYTDSAEALLSISQLPFYEWITDEGIDATTGEVVANSYWYCHKDLAPKMMTNNSWGCGWRDIPTMFEEQNTKTYIFEPSTTWPGNKQCATPSRKGYTYCYFAIDVSMGDVTVTQVGGVEVKPVDYALDFELPEGGQYKVYDTRRFGPLVIYSRSVEGLIIRGPRNSSSVGDARHYIELERTDGKDYREALVGYNAFYKVAELEAVNLKLSGFYGEMPIEKYTLMNLVTRPTLSDLGQSLHNPIVSNIFSYNKRLNIVVEKEVLRPCSSLSVQNPASYEGEDERRIWKAYVEVFENSQLAYVEIEAGDGRTSLSDLVSFVYPRSSAEKLILYVGYDWPSEKVVIPLKKHDFLNIAYAFNYFQELESEVIEIPSANVNTIIESPGNNTLVFGNKIRVSSVNNPFHFSEENTSDLPVNKIYALSTAAKALSEGQFGQFPLYAFTNDGVWALEVSNTGVYSARQPITRDVVINVDSITQIDSAVLFATDRGIMLLSGSTVECISDSINNADELFRITDLPKSDALMNIFNMKSGTGLSVDDITLFPFIDFIKRCRMVYDYTNQHIILYNSAVKYAYVFSLKSKYWGMILSNISYNVNSYPEALAVTTDNRLVDFSKSDVNTVAALAVTRPFVIDDPNTFKTINTIIQRGMFRSKHVRQVLYGSNDLYHWHAVWSSVDRLMRGFRGTPYKAYRLALICNFDKGESISGFTVVFEPRMTNQVR